MKLFCLHYWEDKASNKYYCAATDFLGTPYNKWYVIPRIMDMSLTDYIEYLLKNDAKHISYYEPTDTLTFDFEDKSSVSKFCRTINKIAKDKKYYIA